MSLVGAPGMGKSRLLDEFRQRLTEQPIQCAAGHCLAYGSGTPPLPVLDLLRKYCGITVEDDAETRLTKVRARLQRAGLDPDASLPYLLHLLGLPVDADRLAHLSAETRKARAFEIVRQLFLTSSRHHPLGLATTNGDSVLHALTNQHLGTFYCDQGDYRRAIDCLGQAVMFLDGARRRERFGEVLPPAVYPRAYLAGCHAELGMFPERLIFEEERVPDCRGGCSSL